MAKPARSVSVMQPEANSAEAGVVDPREAAESAGLVYVSDEEPGIRRRRAGKGFAYKEPGGTSVRDEATLARIRSLAIPPAWTDVWICPDPNGHIQATGRDAKGRKQYRYHPRWREVRDGTVGFYAREHVPDRGIPRKLELLALEGVRLASVLPQSR